MKPNLTETEQALLRSAIDTDAVLRNIEEELLAQLGPEKYARLNELLAEAEAVDQQLGG